MRRKRHPLEIYQRGKPFVHKPDGRGAGGADGSGGDGHGSAADSDPTPRHPSSSRAPKVPGTRRKKRGAAAARPKRVARKSRPRSSGKAQALVARARLRVQSAARVVGRLPLRSTVIPLSALVLVVLGVYAVGFWWLPQLGKSTDGTPALEHRNEWPDRFGGGEEQPPAPEPLCCIKVASGKIPADPTRQSEVLQRWFADESRLNEDLELNFPERGVRAKAVWLGDPSSLEAALLVGPWLQREDPELGEILGWVQETYPEATVFRTSAEVFSPPE